MKNGLFQRFPPVRSLSAFCAVGKTLLLLLVTGLCFGFWPAFGAPPVGDGEKAQPSDTTTPVVQPGQTATSIGDSGYVVPIPEIKMNRILGDRPGSQTPAPAKKEPPPPVVEKAQPDTTTDMEPEGGPVLRLPFEPAGRKPAVERPLEIPTLKETPVKPDRSPVLQPPSAPDDLVQEAPPPKKEVIRKKPTPTLPSLLDAEPAKEVLKTLPLERLRTDEAPDEWIPLDTRRQPEITPGAEPEPQPELLPQPVPESTQPEPEIERAPVPEPVEESAQPKESISSLEPAVPEAKESLPSPLDEAAPENPEVKDYLRETAPVLEELSLLMTRAPSLTIADYDPSDANAPIVPKEIYVKLDAMKRELQILDSKTFAIIPPAKYAQFHSIIRESITQTIQACDAIIHYFNDSSPENFQQVQNHLTKARELIQRIRTAHG